jgi:hypothetical protein
MSSQAVRWAPIVPQRPQQPSDRAWIEAYQRRHQAARAGRYNRVVAADLENPNTQLNRAVQEMNLRAERRAVGRGRVRRLLADAALANDVKRYREDRYETLALIERLEGRPGSARRAVYDPGHTGPDCQVCAEARRMEASQAAAPPAVRAGTGTGYCRGCGALAGWCVCVQH